MKKVSKGRKKTETVKRVSTEQECPFRWEGHEFTFQSIVHPQNSYAHVGTLGGGLAKFADGHTRIVQACRCGFVKAQNV